MKRFRPVTWLLLGFIKLWRAIISPLYGNVCKYHPSCSAYGLRAVDVHGAFKGSGLIVWRLLRCNPWSAGGYDPVPGTPEAAQWSEEQRGIQEQRGTEEDRGMQGPRGKSGAAPSSEAPHSPTNLSPHTPHSSEPRNALPEVTL